MAARLVSTPPKSPTSPVGAVFHQREANGGWSDPLQLPHVLGAVQAATCHRNLMKRLAHRGIEDAAVEGEGRGHVSNRALRYNLSGSRAPALLRERAPGTARVPGDSKGLLSGPARGLVLAVSISGGAAEDRDDDLRSKTTNDSDYILENRVPGPVLPGFVHRLGEAEIIGAGEVLACPIQLAGRPASLPPS